MAGRAQVKPKHNADHFLNERNVQQKSLERAMRGLNLEKNYIMKHMDMDRKFFQTRCEKFQAEVAKIKSNLTTKQIEQIQRSEMRNRRRDDDEESSIFTVAEADMVILDIVEEANEDTDANDTSAKNANEKESENAVDESNKESSGSLKPLLTDGIFKTADPVERPSTQRSPKGSETLEAEGNVREIKVKIIEPSEEDSQPQSSVPKLPSASGKKELKPAIKLRRSTSLVDLQGPNSSLPAIPTYRGKSQPATAGNGRRNTMNAMNTIRSSTADPLNWTYSSGMFSCHNLRTSRIDFGLIEKPAAPATNKDVNTEGLLQMLKDETELNKVMIKRRKQSLFQRVEQTIALTKPAPARSTPSKSPVDGDNDELLSVQQADRPESCADSFSEDLEQLRDTIRFRKMERWKNRDRRRSSLLINVGKKDEETDEEYEKRLTTWKKDMKKCRYLRRKESLTAGLGTETLVSNQRAAQKIWRESLANNLF
ncbi:hypothetical protein HOLleu_29606 [Holothuria leucospilota]|uniref:Uncharacterized protein n=1 Tax=Holothuria leucospilota TaxID=206669 RepID=A0A9Q1BP18_HOLLE|nr:hypothetical protein HOLleu_29606 [Holothuria leucospilota]